MVANNQSSDTQRRAGKLHAHLQYGRIDEILSPGPLTGCAYVGK